jgi:hypothetical protein
VWSPGHKFDQQFGVEYRDVQSADNMEVKVDMCPPTTTPGGSPASRIEPHSGKGHRLVLYRLTRARATRPPTTTPLVPLLTSWKPRPMHTKASTTARQCGAGGATADSSTSTRASSTTSTTGTTGTSTRYQISGTMFQVLAIVCQGGVGGVVGDSSTSPSASSSICKIGTSTMYETLGARYYVLGTRYWYLHSC